MCWFEITDTQELLCIVIAAPVLERLHPVEAKLSQIQKSLLDAAYGSIAKNLQLARLLSPFLCSPFSFVFFSCVFLYMFLVNWTLLSMPWAHEPMTLLVLPWWDAWADDFYSHAFHCLPLRNLSILIWYSSKMQSWGCNSSGLLIRKILVNCQSQPEA